MKLIAYTDGGSRGNPGPAAAAAVLYSEDGSKLVGVSEYLGETTNNQAEYVGAILALKKAEALGADEVDVYMDSELVVRQLKGEYKVKNADLARRFLEVHHLRAKFKRTIFRHVVRERNKAADALVNKTLDEYSVVE